MPIAIACGQCDWTGTVRDELAGRRGKCPTCGEPVTVPRPAAPADVEAAAAAALLEGDDGPAPTPPRSYAPPMATAYATRRPEPAAERAAPKPVGMKFEFRAKEQPASGGWNIHPGVGIGLLMMVGAAVWFFVALAAGWIFFYPPILFVLGLARFIYGLAGRDD